MATVKELAKKLDDLETRHLCAEKLIIGLIAELDKAQGRITSLEDLATDYVEEIDQEFNEFWESYHNAKELCALIKQHFNF